MITPKQFMPIRALKALTLTAAIVTGSILFAAAASGPAANTDGAKPVGPVAIVFTGEQNGQLTPCGCFKPMIGGLTRRSTFLKSIATGSSLIPVENGDLVDTIGRQNELKAETTVEALNKMGYVAINLGEKDFLLSVPFLRSLESRFKGAMLSANVLGQDGKPVFKPYSISNVQTPSGPKRVAFIGVVSDQFKDAITASNPDLKVEDQAAAVERHKQQMLAGSDFRVLLYHGTKAEAQALAGQVGFFDLVIFSHAGDHPDPEEKDGKTVYACAGQDGKYVGVARLDSAKTAEIQYTSLEPKFADEPDVQQIKLAYLDRVTAEKLLGQVAKLPTDNGLTYVGTAACQNCHKSAYKVWTESNHAHAIKSLAEVKEDKDPECVPCHVVALDRLSGYVNQEKTPHLQNVGCEACHGPGSAHAKDITKKMGKVGEDSCKPCHVVQHSPNFDYAKFWPKIAHQRE